VRPEQDPVAGDQVEKFVSSLQNVPAAEHDHPLVSSVVVSPIVTAHAVPPSGTNVLLAPAQRVLGSGVQFCSTTQQTPAGGAPTGPCLQRVVGG
jgi:hypothetical protein